MADRLADFLERNIVTGVAPGAVALLGGGSAESMARGLVAVGGPPMRTDAIFRIQSMTKAVTAVAAVRLVEAGRIELDDPVQTWLPELADRRVLREPGAALDDTVAAVRPITLRHLLTNMSGYGMIIAPSPLQEAMTANKTEAGADPPAMGADEWLAALADLPLVGQPGEVWRYHHSFSILGILISRLTSRLLGDHLAEDLFGPLGMDDTGFWVPDDKLTRLPAGYRQTDGGLVETEPSSGGFYAGPPPFDVSHNELVSTAADYHRFLQALITDDVPLISAEHRAMMITDQVPVGAKTDDSFFPGFWQEMGWGFGVGVQTGGSYRGRFTWSGGQGTNFFVDPDGTIGILLTQVEIGPGIGTMIDEFGRL